MNVFVTGDLREFDTESFNYRFHNALNELGIKFEGITRIIRTAYGGTELRAQEMAKTYGIPVEQILPPEGYGKVARFAATNKAMARADVAIIFEPVVKCAQVEHIKKAAVVAEVPFVIA